jgi:hypothetical protein
LRLRPDVQDERAGAWRQPSVFLQMTMLLTTEHSVRAVFIRLFLKANAKCQKSNHYYAVYDGLLTLLKVMNSRD